MLASPVLLLSLVGLIMGGVQNEPVTARDSGLADINVTPSDVTTDDGAGPRFFGRPKFSLKAHLGDAKPIRDYGIPVVSFYGLTSNALSFALMQRKSLRSTSTAVHFSTLAVADSWNLLHALSFQWSGSYFDYTIWGESGLMCKLNDWTMLFGLTWGAWVVVCLTGERLLVTMFPLHAKKWCNHRTALVTALTVTALFAILWTVLIFMWGMTDCFDADYKSFMNDYGYRVAAGTYSAGPSLILLSLNGALVHQLVRTQRKRKLMSGDTLSAKQASLTFKASVTACVVSVAYFVLTLPSSVLQTMNVTGYLEPGSVHIIASESFFIARLLNHGINLLLYLMASEKMRKEFVAMLTCRDAKSIKSRKPRSQKQSTAIETISKTA